MKTTAKIILGLLVLMLVVTTVLMVSFRLSVNHADIVPGSGKIVSQELALQPFSEVSAQGNFTLYLQEGLQEEIRIEADDNLIEFLNTEIRDNKLLLEITRPMKNPTQFDVFVTYVSLNQIKASSAVRVHTQGILSGESLGVEIKSGARTDITLNVSDLNLEVGSGANAVFSGQALDVSLTVRAGAVLQAVELLAKQMKIDASEGARAEVNVTELLSVNAKSGSHVFYKGNPRMDQLNLSSGAELSRLSDN